MVTKSCSFFHIRSDVVCNIYNFLIIPYNPKFLPFLIISLLIKKNALPNVISLISKAKRRNAVVPRSFSRSWTRLTPPAIAALIIWDKDKDVQRCLLVINARHGFGKVTDWSNELVRIINFPLGRTTWICVRGFLHSS